MSSSIPAGSGSSKPPPKTRRTCWISAFGLEETSRLGCQIVMTEALDGLVVRLPSGSRNLLNES